MNAQDWISIEDELPPQDTWVYTTPNIEDAECTGERTFTIDDIELLRYMRGSYTHWCLK